MDIPSRTGNRMAMLRFMMIVGIVILHTPPYVAMKEIGNDFFDLGKAFFQLALFRATVPVLSLISGYLLFQSGVDQHFLKLMKKKLAKLAVPFLFFNLSVLGAAYLLERYLGIVTSDPLADADLATWLDAAFSLTALPVNYPLHFLRDLLVAMLLAPVLGLLLREYTLRGLVLVVTFFYFNLDQHLIMRTEIIIMFYLGGLLAVKEVDMHRLDGFAVHCVAILVLFCCAILYFRVENLTPFRLAAPFLIWPAAALFDQSRAGAWLCRMSKYSFFLFLIHAPLTFLVFILYRRTMPVPYEVFWLLSPVLVASISVFAYKLLSRFVPKVFNFAVGNESRSAGQAARAGARPVLVQG